MSAAIKLHELPPSPNNMKVRVALGYKQLEYERVPLQFDEYPGDRSAIIRASRQPLTPVLVHGDTVMFDSGAILRYLEANFPESPPLFSGDFETMRKIEEWEWMGRMKISEPVSIIFGQAFGERNEETCRRASALMHELTGPVESQLAQTPFLVTDHPTSADVTAVPYIWYSMLPPEAAEKGPIVKFFHDSFQLGEGRERTRDWVRKVLAYDPDYAGG